MKKLLTGIITVSLLILPLFVLAGPQAPPAVDIIDALLSLRDWLFGILLIVAVIFIVIAGYNFITAQGDPDKVHKARQFVLYALVGVAVAVASWALVDFVANDIMG